MNSTFHHQDAQSRFERIFEGDRVAFDLLVTPLIPKLRQQLQHMVAPSCVDDILQETLLSAWTKRNHLREVDAFAGWLLQICKRHALDWQRRKYAPSHTFASQLFDDPSTVSAPSQEMFALSPEDLLLQQQMHDLLHEALATLPPQQRAVMTQRTLRDLTPQETAQQLNIAPKTAYATEAEAKKKLKQHPSMQRAWEIFSALGSLVVTAVLRIKKACSFGGSAALTQTAGSVAVVTALTLGVALPQLAPKGAQMPPSSSSIFADIPNVSSAPPARPAPIPPITPASRKTNKPSVPPQKTPAPMAKTTMSSGAKPMKTKSLFLGAIALAAMLSTPPAFAQSAPRAAKNSNPYSRVQIINMTGDDIFGDTTKPFLLDISATQKAKHKSLIKMRKHWKHKTRQSISQL